METKLVQTAVVVKLPLLHSCLPLPPPISVISSIDTENLCHPLSLPTLSDFAQITPCEEPNLLQMDMETKVDDKFKL